jgi:hypothetical protein
LNLEGYQEHFWLLLIIGGLIQEMPMRRQQCAWKLASRRVSPFQNTPTAYCLFQSAINSITLVGVKSWTLQNTISAPALIKDAAYLSLRDAVA